MSKIIDVGSLNMDLVISAPYMPQKGETLIGSGFTTSPGGKGANQAVAAARLNSEVYMVGCVGNDIFGSKLIENLKLNNVNIDYVKTISGVPTGTAVIILAGGDNRIILDSGTNFQISQKQVEDALNDIGTKDDILLVQMEIPIECVESALIKGREKGMINILNPAPAVKLSDSIYKMVDIIIPNESECEILSGIKPVNPVAIEKAAMFFMEKGVKEVIITMGKDGVAYTKDKLIKRKDVPDVKVVDTTAAGDSFCGALARCLASKMSISESIEFCNTVGTLTVKQKGAQNSLPYYDEVITSLKSYY
ncbi:MAG: ribokinase [Ruminiclostridium sp.]